jgi:predicted nucleotidyltransferase
VRKNVKTGHSVDIVNHIMAAGYPLPASSIIHSFIGGSGLHGAKVSGYDDLDIYAAYIEPPSSILGLQGMEHFVWSSGSDKTLNTAADVDVTMYSLHRWGELMVKGNPAILHYLFADVFVDPPFSAWNYISAMRDELITKKSAKQYLGFANSQRMRLTGERGMGRHGQRPDLIEKHGFDTKFAMHYLRLLYECRELLMDRTLTFPRPEKLVLISVRQGELTQDEVFAVGKDLMAECEDQLRISTLPEQVDVNKLSKRISEAYLAHWHRR